MAYVSGTLVGSKDFLLDFYASAAFVAGQLVVREATASNIGEAANPAGTGSGGLTDTIDILGIATDAATSNTSPTREPGSLLVSPTLAGLENLVRVQVNPFAIYRFQVAGGATAGTALATGNPANVLVITTADAVTPYATLTAAGASGNPGTINMSGGLIKGKTGNNVGSIRKLISQVNSTSVTVGIGFLNPTAIGDTFIRVPYSRAVAGMQMTTDFTQANGLISVGSLGAFRVYQVIIDEANTLAWVDVVPSDHWWNPESA